MLRRRMLSEEGAWLFLIGIYALLIFMLARWYGRWYLLQVMIVLAIVSGNIYLKVTPNPYLPVLFGAAVAFGITVLITTALDRMARARAARARQPRVPEGFHSTDHAEDWRRLSGPG